MSIFPSFTVFMRLKNEPSLVSINSFSNQALTPSPSSIPSRKEKREKIKKKKKKRILGLMYVTDKPWITLFPLFFCHVFLSTDNLLFTGLATVSFHL